MNSIASFAFDYTSLLAGLIVATALSSVLLLGSFLLTVSKPDPEKTSPYECGFEPFNDARDRFSVRFHLVAILFLVFDVELAFLFPWVNAASSTGWIGYMVVFSFIVILTLGFMYEVAKGALNHQ